MLVQYLYNTNMNSSSGIVVLHQNPLIRTACKLRKEAIILARILPWITLLTPDIKYILISDRLFEADFENYEHLLAITDLA